MASPSGEVHKQSADREIGSQPVIARLIDPFLKPISHGWLHDERYSNFGLAWMVREIHGDDQTLGGRLLPAEGDEAVVSPIAIPSRRAIEQLPRPVAHGRIFEHGQQTFVELGKRSIFEFGGCSNEVRRDAFAAAFELTLMEESQTGREERDDGGGSMFGGVERRGGARLIVIF